MSQRTIPSNCPMCQMDFDLPCQGYTINVNLEKLKSNPDTSNYRAMKAFVDLLKPGNLTVIKLGESLVCWNCFELGLKQIDEVINDAEKCNTNLEQANHS